MTDILERLALYSRVWGELPSIPPHILEAPGFTTGKVILDANDAASEIARLRAALEEIKDSPHKYGDEAADMRAIAREALAHPK